MCQWLSCTCLEQPQYEDRSSLYSYQYSAHQSSIISENGTDSSDSKNKQSPADDDTMEILGPLADKEQQSDDSTASTGTVSNERLMAELQQEIDSEKSGGARSQMGKKMGLSSFRSDKTDEERQVAIDQARDLNGVNPVVTVVGSLFALAGAAGLWWLTQYLAEFFAMRPIETDVYFVARVTSVFRNVVMGLVSLASGFFGVTGVGIFLLGVRVAYGVTTGELDPTPIVRKNKDEDEKAVDFGNVWDLMTNKNQKR